METDLIKKYQSDPRRHGKELTQIVDLYRRDVKVDSRAYYRKFFAMRPDVSLRDYETVATTAVLYAALHYDCEGGASFRTFLRDYIKWECLKLVRETGNTLKMPRPKKKQSDERKAISLEDVSVEDFATISKKYEKDMYQRRDNQRHVEQFEKLLKNMQKHPLAAQRKRAKRLQAFWDHISMGGCKKNYCDTFGVSRTTLYADLEAVHNFFPKKIVQFPAYEPIITMQSRVGLPQPGWRKQPFIKMENNKMAIGTIAALAAKKAVAEVAPIVVTAVATAVTKEIIEHPDEAVGNAICAPFLVAADILDRIDKML